jgi:hypothetical protein
MSDLEKNTTPEFQPQIKEIITTISKLVTEGCCPRFIVLVSLIFIISFLSIETITRKNDDRSSQINRSHLTSDELMSVVGSMIEPDIEDASYDRLLDILEAVINGDIETEPAEYFLTIIKALDNDPQSMWIIDQAFQKETHVSFNQARNLVAEPEQLQRLLTAQEEFSELSIVFVSAHLVTEPYVSTTPLIARINEAGEVSYLIQLPSEIELDGYYDSSLTEQEFLSFLDQTPNHNENQLVQLLFENPATEFITDSGDILQYSSSLSFSMGGISSRERISVISVTEPSNLIVGDTYVKGSWSSLPAFNPGNQIERDQHFLVQAGYWKETATGDTLPLEEDDFLLLRADLR